jgi:hypothetical protein
MEDRYETLMQHKLILGDTCGSLNTLLDAFRNMQSFEEKLKPIMAQADKAGSRNIRNLYAQYPMLELYMLSLDIREVAGEEKGWTDNEIAADLEERLSKVRISALYCPGKLCPDPSILVCNNYAFNGPLSKQ